MNRASVLLSVSLLLPAGIAFTAEEKVDKPKGGILTETASPVPGPPTLVVHAPEASDVPLPPTFATISPGAIQEIERSIILPPEVGLGDTIRLRINCATGALTLLTEDGDINHYIPRHPT